MAIKDNICTEGIETTCSSKILRGFVPPYSAEAALNLKKPVQFCLARQIWMNLRWEVRPRHPGLNRAKTRGIQSMYRADLPVARVRLSQRERPFCSWFRYGRFHPPAKFLLRRDRHQTDLWNGFPVWSDRLWFLAGSDWTGLRKIPQTARQFWRRSLPMIKGQHLCQAGGVQFYRCPDRRGKRDEDWNPVRLSGRRTR